MIIKCCFLFFTGPYVGLQYNIYIFECAKICILNNKFWGWDFGRGQIFLLFLSLADHMPVYGNCILSLFWAEFGRYKSELKWWWVKALLSGWQSAGQLQGHRHRHSIQLSYTSQQSMPASLHTWRQVSVTDQDKICHLASSDFWKITRF